MATQKIPHIAIIGCGAVTERGHLPAITTGLDCQINILIDSNLTRAKQLADFYNIPAVSGDYKDALEHADAAIVALPHHLHFSVSRSLLKAGLHVLVEKPMATSLAECDAMIAEAERNDVVLAVGLMRRFLHSAHFARWILAQDLLGPLQEFDFREGNIYNWAVQSDFFFQRETAGGGVLFDTGAHTLDLLLWWLGDVADFDYYDDSYGGVEADCQIDISMTSGVKGRVELSRTRNLRNTAIIRGERGILEVHLRNNWARLYALDKTTGLAGPGLTSDILEEQEQAFGDLFQPQIENWLAAIRGEQQLAVPGAESRRSIAFIEACYAQRKPLELPWISPRDEGEKI